MAVNEKIFMEICGIFDSLKFLEEITDSISRDKKLKTYTNIINYFKDEERLNFIKHNNSFKIILENKIIRMYSDIPERSIYKGYRDLFGRRMPTTYYQQI